MKLFLGAAKNQINQLKKVIIVAILIGFLASFLAISLKRITEHYESLLFLKASKQYVFYFLFPIIGLTMIHFLRKYLFRNKENKGIKEIFESIETPDKKLPLYKIPSHFINGFLTVIFGGATGIEVSTVVASATIGSVAQHKAGFLNEYKKELIGAGVAAGITALFSSPLAGILFSLEVITRKVNKVFLITNLLAVAIASGLIYFLEEPTLFVVHITTWHGYAIPYFIVLGLLASLNSVFLTKSVLFFKDQFKKIKNPFFKTWFGALLIGSVLCLYPVLFGDGYHGVKELFTNPNANFTPLFFISIIGILILKPIITSVTLASGGDGGVFAPSIVMGAFLGFLLATILNSVFEANVIPVNFIIIGMAALLSASIHAPFTALFLVCGITNDYTLFLPILITCLISKYTAKYLYPYTVYSYSKKLVTS